MFLFLQCSSKSRNVDRYGVQSIEWVIFTVMTTVVLIGTLVIILVSLCYISFTQYSYPWIRIDPIDFFFSQLPVTQKGMMEEVPLPPSMKRSRIWYEKACTFYFHLYKWRDQRMIRERLHLLFDLVQILTDYVNSLLRMLDVTVVRSWDGRIWRHNWSITMRSTDILTICREAFVVHLTLFHSFGFSHFLLISVDVVSFFWLLGFPIFY